jgi:hypothetical protein
LDSSGSTTTRFMSGAPRGSPSRVYAPLAPLQLSPGFENLATSAEFIQADQDSLVACMAEKVPNEGIENLFIEPRGDLSTEVSRRTLKRWRWRRWAVR